MNLNIYSFIILSSVYLCCACGNSAVNSKTIVVTKDNLYKITIRVPDIDTLQDIYLSEIADSVMYVALSDEIPLAGMLRVETTDSVILVSSVIQDLEMLELYDLNGN